MSPARPQRQRGAALVEFALTALVLYLVIAGGTELGRMVFVSQVLQDAARLAARELSVTPLPAGCSFEEALNYPDPLDPQSPNPACPPPALPNPETDIRARVWNPNLLVIDLACYPTDEALTAYRRSLPVVNQALEPLFISDVVDPGQPTERRLLRYPGALVPSGTPAQTCPETYDPVINGTGNPSDLAVVVYGVSYPDGVETLDPTPIPILREIRNYPPNIDCGPWGPFNQLPDNILRPMDCVSNISPGLAAVEITYPFQSAALSSFQNAGVDANGAPNPNMGGVIESVDPDGTPFGPYTGPNGLGNQAAMATVVRPYRRLLVGQSMFRREVFQ